MRCRFGRVEACKVLINTGQCNPNAVTNVDFWTPLHHAALNGQRYVIEYLLAVDGIDVVCSLVVHVNHSIASTYKYICVGRLSNTTASPSSPSLSLLSLLSLCTL